jgi:hypothetical protein
MVWLSCSSITATSWYPWVIGFLASFLVLCICVKCMKNYAVSLKLIQCWVLVLHFGCSVGYWSVFICLTDNIRLNLSRKSCCWATMLPRHSMWNKTRVDFALRKTQQLLFFLIIFITHNCECWSWFYIALQILLS